MGMPWNGVGAARPVSQKLWVMALPEGMDNLQGPASDSRKELQSLRGVTSAAWSGPQRGDQGKEKHREREINDAAEVEWRIWDAPKCSCTSCLGGLSWCPCPGKDLG